MRNFFLLLGTISLICFSMNCQNEMQSSGHLPGKDEIKVSWENISNFISEDPRHRVVFTLENNSRSYTFRNKGWAMYFNQSPRRPIPGSVSPEAMIEHINGDWFALKPRDSFVLNPGESINISADFSDAVIKRTDAPLGVYFVFFDEDGKETGRLPVENYTIKPFDNPDQVNRSPGDETPIPTPEWRYEKNKKLTLLEEKDLYQVIPTPISIARTEGKTVLGEGAMIHYAENLDKEADLLASQLSQIMTTRPMTMPGDQGGPNIITLKTENITIQGKSTEAYTLVISEQGIDITGSDPAGVFYGIQSLIASCPVESFKTPQSEIQLDNSRISDAPAFNYRGLHLDLARNFQKKSTILKLIDAIAFYKLNKLHLHLTDDEGWRIEIEELPELTEIGGFRGHTTEEKQYLQPSYGSGPFPDPETSHGNGYLTREEFKDIIRYAHERHIEVIPEINMPGHARAAIKAMEARYRRLMAEGNPQEAEEFLLSDPEDASEYLSAQWYNDNIICVCNESAYRFYETVIDDVIQMYHEAGVPLKTIHTGGDEVPRGAWEKSPICQEFLVKNPSIEGAQNLQPYFFGRIVELLNKKDLMIGGWEEVAMRFRNDGTWYANEEFTDNHVIPYVWNSLWGNQDLGYRLANSGYPVVLCNVNNFYFDLAYNKDPKEPGLYWGGFVNTRTAFEFIPFDLFKSMTVSPSGIPFDEERDFKGMERLTNAGKQNIIGIQAELWSETIKGNDMLEYYYLPKLIGMAQRAWQGQARWGNILNEDERKTILEQDWNSFVNSIGQREFPRLAYIYGGFNYRIPLPGVKVIDDKIHANLSYPGMTIRYTTGGTEPDENSTEYKGPLEAKGTIKFRTFDTRNQASRTSAVMVE